MRWSRLLITTALSLFVIFGLIDAINAQRGRVRFSQQPASASSSSRPWADDTALLVSAEEDNYSRSVEPTFRRRIPVTEAAEPRLQPASYRRRVPTTSEAAAASSSSERPARPVGRSRQRAAQQKPQPVIQSRSLDVSSEEEFSSRRTTKEQYAPSLRSEVVVQNGYGRSSERSSEEKVSGRRGKVTRQRETTSSTTSTTTAASARAGRKLNRLSASRFSNEVEEVQPSSSARSVEGRSRGQVKAPVSREKMDDISSDENYPEEFKRMLKAKLQEDKQRSVSVNKLEVSTVKSLFKAEVPRFKAKPSTETPSTTVRVITPRPIRTFVSSVTVTEAPSTTVRTVAPRARVVTPTPLSQRPTKKLVSARARATSSTTPEPKTTVPVTTVKPTKAFSRKPSVVSLLTSTTTPSTTTTRKPYTPNGRTSGANRKTFTSTSAPEGNSVIEPSKRASSDTSFVFANLRQPSAFRSAQQQKPRKPLIPVVAEYSSNDLKPVSISIRPKPSSSLSALKRSQSSGSGSRVGPRFESSLKKTPVYTPTIPTFTTPTTTAPGANFWDDGHHWSSLLATEPGLFNRLPPTASSTFAVAPTPSFPPTPTTTASSASYYHHHQHSVTSGSQPGASSSASTYDEEEDDGRSRKQQQHGSRKDNHHSGKRGHRPRGVPSSSNSLTYVDDDDDDGPSVAPGDSARQLHPQERRGIRGRRRRRPTVKPDYNTSFREEGHT